RHEHERARHVALAIRSGKDDDGRSHDVAAAACGGGAVTSTLKFSITVLASSFSAASRSVCSALAGSPPSSSMSNTLPRPPPATPPSPSDFSAPSIALPCGSSTPDFNVTTTRAFMPGPRSAFPQHRAGALRPFAFRHDAEALGDFRVGLEQPAE